MSDLARVALRVLPRKAASTSPQRHPRKTEPGVTEHRRKSSHPAAEIRVPSRAQGPKKRPPGAGTACLDPIPGLDAEGLAGRGLHRGFGSHPPGSPPLAPQMAVTRDFHGKGQKKMAGPSPGRRVWGLRTSRWPIPGVRFLSDPTQPRRESLKQRFSQGLSEVAWPSFPVRALRLFLPRIFQAF